MRTNYSPMLELKTKTEMNGGKCKINAEIPKNGGSEKREG